MIVSGIVARDMAQSGMLVFGPGCRKWTVTLPDGSGETWFIVGVGADADGQPVWNVKVVKSWSA